MPDGAASTINTSGGLTSNYTYQWDSNANSQNTATASSLLDGGYCVTITDPVSTAPGGCSVPYCVTVAHIPGPSSTATNTPAICNGDCNGTATVSPIANGGSTVFDFSWD